jgi:TatD DNase family protein
VHPWWAHEQAAGWSARLREALEAEPAAAVGECGLDRARLDCGWEEQLRAFDLQLGLACELRRAVVVHCVRADGVLMERLRAAAAAPAGLPPVLVMHAFGGSVESARAIFALCRDTCAAYFGFSPRAAALRRAGAVLAALPAERLLLESDEHGGEEAARAIEQACAAVAQARGWSEEEAAETSAENARRAFDAAAWR